MENKSSPMTFNERILAKTFKGNFNVRLSAELHQKAAVFASWQGISLNDFVRKAVLFALENQEEITKKQV